MTHRVLFAFLFVLFAASSASAQGDPVRILPSGVTYSLGYLAKTHTDRICFYEVESSDPDAAFVDRDGAEGITEADALLCETPAATCDEGACVVADHRNDTELSVVSVRDFLLVAVAYRTLPEGTLESPRSNLGQALVAPGPPVLLGGAWLGDFVADGGSV